MQRPEDFLVPHCGDVVEVTVDDADDAGAVPDRAVDVPLADGGR
jgi:hypothetical protein